jgi:transposase InsO family protein
VESHKKIVRNMSRKANCWDNAVVESFFKTLKSDLVYGNKFQTIKEAKTAVFEYIEIWYNRKRLHSSLGYRTPQEMETYLLNIKLAA